MMVTDMHSCMQADLQWHNRSYTGLARSGTDLEVKYLLPKYSEHIQPQSDQHDQIDAGRMLKACQNISISVSSYLLDFHNSSQYGLYVKAQGWAIALQTVSCGEYWCKVPKGWAARQLLRVCLVGLLTKGAHLHRCSHRKVPPVEGPGSTVPLSLNEWSVLLSLSFSEQAG